MKVVFFVYEGIVELFFTKKRKIGLVLILMLAALDVFIFKEVLAVSLAHYLKVDVLDVGQGDSIFIQTPAMRRIIIDGGPDSTLLAKLQQRLPFWQRQLDVIILTHPDADHIVGLLKIIEKYKVDYIIWTGIVRDGGNYEKWIELIRTAKKKGSIIIAAKAGTAIASGGVIMKTLHPFGDLTGHFLGKEGNDTGIVERLSYGKKSFLFTADISSKVEAALINNNINLASDVLKVAHHGSKYSSAEEFLRAVSPGLAVISAGKNNPYGHPTPEVLQNLQKFGISVVRTDQRGDIMMISDGENIKINSR